MSDLAIRVTVLVLLVVAASAIGWGLRRRVSDGHPLVDLGLLDIPHRVVIFTSTDCAKCKEAVAILKHVDTPTREITWELEPGLQERVGVETVPLTIVRNRLGATVAQFTGVPSARRLRRAVARAGR